MGVPPVPTAREARARNVIASGAEPPLCAWEVRRRLSASGRRRTTCIMYHDGESGQGDGGRREEGTTITAAEWNRPGGHDPSVAVRVGEAANPGPRVPASATPAPTDVSTTPVPTDISASDGHSPVRVLLDTFEEMDHHDGEEEDGALPPGTPCAPPSERRRKRWQTRGSEVCSACSQGAPRGTWGCMRTACSTYFCGAPCRRRASGAHVCSDDAHVAVTVVPPSIVEERVMPEEMRAIVTSGHVDEAVSIAEFDALLGAAVARPAIRTLETIPGQHRARVAEILTALMIAHVDAQRATACGGHESEEAALRAARLLWIAPALLLRAMRRNQEDALAPAPTQLGSRGVERANEVRGRLQLAETGR